MRLRLLAKIAAGLAVGAVLAGAAAYGLPGRVRHFDTVQAGVLYRSGQPRGEAWDRLAGDFRIRTVISLRERNPEADWSREEEQACSRLGLRLIRIPIESRDRISQEPWTTFLQTVTDPADWPVLVHCEAGSARTGYLVAGYRIAVQGWSVKNALTEAQAHHWDTASHPDQVAFLEELWQKHHKPDPATQRHQGAEPEVEP